MLLAALWSVPAPRSTPARAALTGKSPCAKASAFLCAGAKRQTNVDQKSAPSFQSLILTLHDYWSRQGCVILQPYDAEMGAGTFHPATALRSLGPNHWKAAYVQPCRRATEGRYGEMPNRLQLSYE